MAEKMQAGRAGRDTEQALMESLRKRVLAATVKQKKRWQRHITS